jgi:hypothetical protein
MIIVPSVARARRARAAAEAEDAFWRENYDRYLKAYPDQFVAIVKDTGRFVAADSDLDRVIDMVNDRGLAVRAVWVRHMTATPIHLVL